MEVAKKKKHGIMNLLMFLFLFPCHSEQLSIFGGIWLGEYLGKAVIDRMRANTVHAMTRPRNV